MSSPRWRRLLIALAIVVLSVACSGRGLTRQYEYEEEIFLKIDGSADIVINASLPALAALRGLPVATDPGVRFDRDGLRAAYESKGIDVKRISRPWRRKGRRFAQVRLEVPDIRRLGEAAPFAWARYAFDRRDGVFVYRQELGAPPAAATLPEAGWDGSELVSFRIHVPSKIQFHNAPSKQVERGNILTWEQPFTDRLAGVPIAMEVRMETESILVKTLTVFGVAVAAALLLLAAIVWWVVRQGRARPAVTPGGGAAAAPPPS
jgi:hypothetical protein